MVFQLDVLCKIDETDNVIFARTSFKMKVTVKNISSVEFPGGRFSKFQYQFSNTAANLVINLEIPKLKPSESIELVHSVFVNEEGLCWIYIQAETISGEAIDLFLGPRNLANDWRLSFYFFRYEDKLIIELLRSINEKLDKIIGKGGK